MDSMNRMINFNLMAIICLFSRMNLINNYNHFKRDGDAFIKIEINWENN